MFGGRGFDVTSDLGSGYPWLLVLAALPFTFACQGATQSSGRSSGTGLGGPTGGSTISQVVGPSGGTVSAPDGTSVQVPAGAVTSNVTITLTPNPSAPAPSGMLWVGTPYVFGPEGTQFALPVTVVLAFAPASIPTGESASQVVVETAPAGSTSYISRGGTLADSTHVRATTTHFSTFGPGIDDSAGATGGSSTGSEGTSTGSATGGGTTGSSSSTGGTTSGGSSAGCVPDAGVIVSLPSSLPDDGGCIGAIGCT